LTGNVTTGVIGRVGGIELMLSDRASFANDQVWLRIIARVDIGLRTPDSLAIYDQILL
jgi:hypothetical protein